MLDQLSTITGFDSVSESGIYSNEIHLSTETLTVRSFKGGEIAKGLYQEIKPKLASVGAKYAKSVYCAVIRQGKSLEIVNIKFSGSALSSLIESKVRDGDTLELSPSTEVLKKGATEYFAPKVVKVNTEVVLFQESLELDRTQLKPFFAQYKKAVPEIVINSVIENDLPEFDTSDIEYTLMPY